MDKLVYQSSLYSLILWLQKTVNLFQTFLKVRFSIWNQNTLERTVYDINKELKLYSFVYVFVSWSMQDIFSF